MGRTVFASIGMRQWLGAGLSLLLLTLFTACKANIHSTHDQQPSTQDSTSHRESVIVEANSWWQASVKPLALAEAASPETSLALAEGDDPEPQKAGQGGRSSMGDAYPSYAIQQGVVPADRSMGVTYFSSDELARYEVIISPDGRFYDIDGQLLKPCPVECIFVMDKKGSIFVANAEIGRIHHSSFFAGGNISAGGTVKFDEMGILSHIDNTTGHYKVPGQANLNVLAELSRRGVSIKSLQVGTFGRDMDTRVEVVSSPFMYDPDYFSPRPDFSEVDQKINDAFAARQSLAIQMDRSLQKFDGARTQLLQDGRIPPARKKALLANAEEARNREWDSLKKRYDSVVADEGKLLESKNSYYDQKVTSFHQWLGSAPKLKVMIPPDVDLPKIPVMSAPEVKPRIR